MRYPEGVPETPLITYLRIQRAQDREMMAMLRTAAASVDAELRRLQSADRIGGVMRRQQLLRSQSEINNRLAQFWEAAGNTIEANTAKAAAAGAETVLRESKDVLLSVLSADDYDYMSRSAQESAVRGLETASQRVSGSSYVPLAESVYDNTALSQGKVDEIVNSALARGASAAELARDVRAFVNPNTPGGLRYASMRLGRTELNNAFHASQVKQAQEEPWVLALRWHLSGSHPRPDACNDYADDVHFPGGEPGQWKPEEVPAKPHPNCLCYTTPDTMDADQFIDAFVRGDFDAYLDDELGPLPDEPASLATPAPVKISPKAAPPASSFKNTDARFWNQWYQESPLTKEQAASVRSYTTGTYERINRVLRTGSPSRKGTPGAASTMAQVQKAVANIDSAMRPTPTSTLTRRGVDLDALGADEATDLTQFVGRSFTDKGYMSTTTKDVGFKRRVQMEVRVPEGTRATWVDPVSRYADLGKPELLENELLLDRGLTYVVESVTLIQPPPKFKFLPKWKIVVRVVS